MSVAGHRRVQSPQQQQDGAHLLCACQQSREQSPVSPAMALGRQLLHQAGNATAAVTDPQDQSPSAMLGFARINRRCRPLAAELLRYLWLTETAGLYQKGVIVVHAGRNGSWQTGLAKPQPQRNFAGTPGRCRERQAAEAAGGNCRETKEVLPDSEPGPVHLLPGSGSSPAWGRTCHVAEMAFPCARQWGTCSWQPQHRAWASNTQQEGRALTGGEERGCRGGRVLGADGCMQVVGPLAAALASPKKRQLSIRQMLLARDSCSRQLPPPWRSGSTG